MSVGHVQKRVGSRLQNLKQTMKGVKLPDGKGIKGKGRSTEKVMNTLQNYYGMSVRQNKGNLYAMEKSVTAVLYHCSENSSQKDRHKYCPRSATSWCRYQTNKITGKKTA